MWFLFLGILGIRGHKLSLVDYMKQQQYSSLALPGKPIIYDRTHNFWVSLLSGCIKHDVLAKTWIASMVQRQ